MTKHKALSMFSGAGGMDIGVTEAGFEVVACVELDRFCCETLRQNCQRSRSKTAVYETDVRIVDPVRLMHILGLKEGELDLLFGGSPCQSFSQIGKQLALDDDRGLLLFQIVRFVEAFKPKAVMIEQVKGLLSAKGARGQRGEVLHLLVSELEQLGYVPKWQVLTAANYGVPQMRQRVFVVATKKPNGFQFPEPTHGEQKAGPALFSLKPYVTVGEVLGGLGRPAAKGCEPHIAGHVDVTPDGDRRRIAGVPEGEYLAAQKHLPKSQVCGLTKKDTTKFLRVSRARPANTLRGGEIFYHPTEDRYLTPREYMRIHGYPDSYLLSGPIRGRSGQFNGLDQHRQVANSVPPPLARVIATNIRKVIECLKSSSCSDTL